jgi:outer membrane protein assembly factor BamB
MMIVYVLLGVAMAAGRAAQPGVIGWRGDGSGNFANADPPTSFCATENLTWKADLGPGCGAAIIVGKRLFVQAAPNALVCLDKASGKELWRRTRHAGNLPATAPAARLDGLMEEVGAYQRVLRQHSSTTDPAVQEARGRLPKDLAIPGLDSYGGNFLICTTPCSDGQRVIAVFPTGIAVAYDLEGTLLWSLDVRPFTARPSTMPMSLAGRWRPIPHFVSSCPVMSQEGIAVITWGGRIAGIEAASAKVLWTDLTHATVGSPVVGRVQGESYVAGSDLFIRRVRDGLRIYEDPHVPSGDVSVTPVFADGVFHWVSHAVRVVPGDPPRAQTVWELGIAQLHQIGRTPVIYRTPRLSGCDDFCSPALVNGQVLYYGLGRLVSVDAATGKVLAQHPSGRSTVRPLSRGVGKNWAYAGVIRAGGHLMVIHDSGLVKMFPINETFAPAKYAAIPDDVYAQPACEGPALYIRSLNAVWRFDSPNTGERR